MRQYVPGGPRPAGAASEKYLASAETSTMRWSNLAGRWSFIPVLLLALVGYSTPSNAVEEPPKTPTAAEAADVETADAPEPADFVRFVEDENGGGRLEAAIATYRNADGVAVHLVSALHVGEKDYYETLSRHFEGYDAVLYEMIKPKETGAPVRGAQSGGMISAFQRFLKDVLELEFQLDAIDYSPENFVHADLDAETFFKLQEDRGESIFTLMLRSMLSEMKRQSAGQGARPITFIDILVAMNSPDSARQYKLLLARQFQDIEAQLAGLEGEDGTVILTERNKAALKVLREEIETGKKNIGVFYGAGHMPGIEEALLDEMGFDRAGVEWVVAWDMTGKPAKTVRDGIGDAQKVGAGG